jgi:seryl-tRNA synthetase
MMLYLYLIQVYQLDRSLHPPMALSGTAEMAIGGLFLNKTVKFPDRKPDSPADAIEKLVAVSRCYRAESSRGQGSILQNLIFAENFWDKFNP